MSQTPLNGIKILDLSRLLPGPYASLLLSDLGAEVTKVEDPKSGDYIRQIQPLCEDGNGAMFHALNRGKKSVSIDLKTPAGLKELDELCQQSDVLLESFRPGVMESFGYDAKSVRKRFPHLIYCRISGYGQEGPDRLKAGHDLSYAARSGLLSMMESPHPLPVQAADLLGGSWPAALQILAALYGRKESGQGTVIDVPMAQGARASMVMALARNAVSGEDISGGKDFLAGAVPCYQVYPTQDGFLTVGGLESKFWERFVAALGLDHLSQKGMSRGDEAEAIKKEISALTQSKTTAHWKSVFKGQDASVEFPNRPEGAAADEQFQSLGGLNIAVQIGQQRIELPRTPITLQEAQMRSEPGPPLQSKP